MPRLVGMANTRCISAACSGWLSAAKRYIEWMAAKRVLRVRTLLLALRVVQPAVACRQETLRGRAHVPAVQGRRHASQAEHHLLRRRVGTGQRRMAVARTAGVAVQRIAGARRGGN